MPGIILDNVSRNYGFNTAVDGVSFEIPEGKIVSLLGPSGSGKTAILRMIAGFEHPNAGSISFDTEVSGVGGAPGNLKEKESLYKHFGLKSKVTVYKCIEDILESTGYRGFYSGGTGEPGGQAVAEADNHLEVGVRDAETGYDYGDQDRVRDAETGYDYGDQDHGGAQAQDQDQGDGDDEIYDNEYGDEYVSLGQAVMHILYQVGLEDHAHKKIKELTPEQQFRAALAKALAARPGVLVMDESLTRFDQKTRLTLLELARWVLSRNSITTVFASADLEEALLMGDMVAVLREGRLQQFGSPQEIFERPVNRFVAELSGRINIFEGFVQGVGNHVIELKTEEGTDIGIPGSASILSPGVVGTYGVFGVRPEQVRVKKLAAVEATAAVFKAVGVENSVDEARHNVARRVNPGVLTGVIKNTYYCGRFMRLEAVSKGITIIAEMDRLQSLPEPGDHVSITWNHYDTMYLKD